MTGAERQRLKVLVDRKIRAMLARQGEAARAGRRPPAEQFLVEALADEPRVGVDLVEEAARQGINAYRVKRAKGKLWIQQTFDAARKRWTWRLPEGA